MSDRIEWARCDLNTSSAAHPIDRSIEQE